jgi:hypothetical protein
LKNFISKILVVCETLIGINLFMPTV